MMTAKMGERDSREEIMKAFKLFDDDNTGFITLKNLKRVAKELGENLTDEELQVGRGACACGPSERVHAGFCVACPALAGLLLTQLHPSVLYSVTLTALHARPLAGLHAESHRLILLL